MATISPKKTLHLVLKKKWFDEIKAGTKKEETREIRPQNARKYIEYLPDEEGVEFASPIAYDQIQFYMGYEKGRPKMLVEVLSVENIILTDDEDNDLTYIHEGEIYVRAINVYKLGAIIST